MGYVGPGVVKTLRKDFAGAHIIGYDMGYFAHCLSVCEVFPETRANVQYFDDVRHVDAELLRGVDVVVHLSAISNDPMGNLYEAVTEDVNYRASLSLAGLAKRAGVKRFVFASSCSIYGSADSEPRTETSELNPLTMYAKSKVQTEVGLKDLADDQFIVTCLRFATACGMSDRLRLDLVLNDFVAGAMVWKKIDIVSDGTPWRPLIHVDDMARAISWAAARGQGAGGVFVSVNAGSDAWNFQVKELAQVVAGILPGTEISINRNAQPDKRSYRVDFSLFKRLAPNHQPQVRIEDAVIQMKERLEAVAFRDADFRNSDLVRLKVLQKLQHQGLLNSNLEWIRS
jgi:nucleoside-diphosphate-sugar epimerase